ncbi:MAG: DHH family phosphoesterase [Candidatus Komeilibacteria bacterium]|nr:DHH family phosphoesterase [Candidatus Komeilibacteria bacterium]
MNDKVAYQIKEALCNAQRVAVICHQDPDGDALGSLTALRDLLGNWNIPTTLFCATPAPAQFNWLPYYREIISLPATLSDVQHDIIVVLDSGSLSYAGVEEIINDLNYDFKLINIDHHATNLQFGGFNYVIKEASSTCEVIYDLLQLWQHPLNSNIATCLLNGIMTDTSGLNNPATSPQALSAAATLMKHGANFQKIITYNVRIMPANLLRLWGVALQRLVYNSKLNCVSTYLTRNDFIDHEIDFNKTEGLSNFLATMGNVRFTMLLVETGDGHIQGSLRTTRDDTNVAALAMSFGGGGHKKAAGFTITGRLAYNNEAITVV